MATLEQEMPIAVDEVQRIVDRIAFEDGSGDPYGWLLDAVAVDNLPQDLCEASFFVDGWIATAARRSGFQMRDCLAQDVAASLRLNRPHYYRQVAKGVLAVANRWRSAMALRPVSP